MALLSGAATIVRNGFRLDGQQDNIIFAQSGNRRDQSITRADFIGVLRTVVVEQRVHRRTQNSSDPSQGAQVGFTPPCHVVAVSALTQSSTSRDLSTAETQRIGALPNILCKRPHREQFVPDEWYRSMYVAFRCTTSDCGAFACPDVGE